MKKLFAAMVGILALFVVTAQQAKKRFWDET